jgi:NitT/TauT family transport system substrate-binding protein
MRGRRVLGLLSTIFLLLGTACGSRSDDAGTRAELRLGFFPNITHAPAIVGLEKGIFRKHLGSVDLQIQTFNAGPQAVEAIFSEGLDATFVGPSPAINAFVKSNGEAIRIVAGATSGGAYFVVKPEIASANDLRGERVASPQTGNTQDVALRAWLSAQGLQVAENERPDVEIVPQENSQTLETFRSGSIAGAWVPEPWASRLILEADGKILVDERDLWPGGRYVTTQLAVRTEFLQRNPEAVRALVRGLVETTDLINADSEEGKSVTGAAIARLTGRSLPQEVVDRAWSNLTFTVDPIASSLEKSAEDAAALGFIDKVDMNSIYDLSHLNAILESAGKPAIKV